MSSLIFSPTDAIILSDTIISPVAPLSLFSPQFTTLPPVNKIGPLTLNLEFERPIVGFLETIDNNPDVRRKMINYIYDLVRDKWLLDDINDVLNYFVYSNGQIQMISNLNEYNPNNIMKDTNQIAEKKVEFIENMLFTKHDLKHVLRKFIKETNTKWVDLPKNKFFLKQGIKEYIIKKIKNKLRNNK